MYNPFQVPSALHSKNPASIKVTRVGKLIPPHFLEVGLKINRAEYLKILENALLPWIRKHYDASQIMFVQDSTPTYSLKRLQKLLKKELSMFTPKDICPLAHQI